MVGNVLDTAWKVTAESYRGQEPTAWRLVNTEQQSYEGYDVVLDEGLIQQGVQHRRAEDVAGGERQSEHVRNVRTTLFLTLLEISKSVNRVGSIGTG